MTQENSLIVPGKKMAGMSRSGSPRLDPRVFHAMMTPTLYDFLENQNNSAIFFSCCLNRRRIEKGSTNVKDD